MLLSHPTNVGASFVSHVPYVLVNESDGKDAWWERVRTAFIELSAGCVKVNTNTKVLTINFGLLSERLGTVHHIPGRSHFFNRSALWGDFNSDFITETTTETEIGDIGITLYEPQFSTMPFEPLLDWIPPTQFTPDLDPEDYVPAQQRDTAWQTIDVQKIDSKVSMNQFLGFPGVDTIGDVGLFIATGLPEGHIPEFGAPFEKTNSGGAAPSFTKKHVTVSDTPGGPVLRVEMKDDTFVDFSVPQTAASNIVADPPNLNPHKDFAVGKFGDYDPNYIAPFSEPMGEWVNQEDVSRESVLSSKLLIIRYFQNIS
jgi:hypothetical protein